MEDERYCWSGCLLWSLSGAIERAVTANPMIFFPFWASLNIVGGGECFIPCSFLKFKTEGLLFSYWKEEQTFLFFPLVLEIRSHS